MVRTSNLRTPRYDKGGRVSASVESDAGGRGVYSNFVSPGSGLKNVRFEKDYSKSMVEELGKDIASPRTQRASDSLSYHKISSTRVQSRGFFDDEAPYSRDYVDQIRKRYKSELEQQESKYRLLSEEYEEFKRNSKQQIASVNKQLEENSFRHIGGLEKLRMEIVTEAEKKAKALEYDNKLLKTKLKEQEHNHITSSKRLEQLQYEFKAFEQTSQETVSELTNRIRVLEEEARVVFESHGNEKRKLKESYDGLISELSTEIKQLYDKMNQELTRKERRISDLEHQIIETQKTGDEKLRIAKVEIESLKENNRYQKKVLEDNKGEILRLGELLDDKRKHLFILESKFELSQSSNIKPLHSDSVYNVRKSNKSESLQSSKF